MHSHIRSNDDTKKTWEGQVISNHATEILSKYMKLVGLTFSTLIIFFYFCFRYVGLSLLWPLPLRSTGSGRTGSAAMAHGPSRSAACGIFPDRGTNLRPLHQQADSQPLRHQGSPLNRHFKFKTHEFDQNCTGRRSCFSV